MSLLKVDLIEAITKCENEKGLSSVAAEIALQEYLEDGWPIQLTETETILPHLVERQGGELTEATSQTSSSRSLNIQNSSGVSAAPTTTTTTPSTTPPTYSPK